ncbi:MAG: hypothetical protein WC055_15640 [Melioribacteraceae bacterium]
MAKKLFRMTYDDLITSAYIFYNEFLSSKERFTEFSSIFEDPFSENFLNYIKEADHFPTIDSNYNHSKILFFELQEYLKVSQSVYQRLIAYLKLIYGNSEAILNAFGKKTYNVARRTPSGMRILLDISHITANNEPYKSDLIAGGFSQSEIDGLLGTANTLNEKLLVHHEYMNNSFAMTAERIDLHNRVWAEMMKINKASKFIFADSPAMIEFFTLKNRK